MNEEKGMALLDAQAAQKRQQSEVIESAGDERLGGTHITAEVALPVKTGVQVKAELARNGISIGSWAKANGFKRADVYAVLDGRNKAKYGDAHAIAVALGMKDGVVSRPVTFLPLSAVIAGAQA